MEKTFSPHDLTTKPAKTREPVDRDEMIAILTEIARESDNAAARIAAVKMLRELDADGPPRSAFDALDELAARREKKGLRPAP